MRIRFLRRDPSLGPCTHAVLDSGGGSDFFLGFSTGMKNQEQSLTPRLLTLFLFGGVRLYAESDFVFGLEHST